MDPIAGTNDEPTTTSTSAEPYTIGATSPGAVEPASANDAPRIDPDSGTLAEVESMRGVLITGSADREADALRRSLELDDRLEAAAATNEEQLEQAETLRRAVTDPRPAAPADPTDGVIDPTERYEIHDAAVTGDSIAQAIEEASTDRADAVEVASTRRDSRELADDAAQEVDERQASAIERFGLEQADAEAATAARAVLSDAAAAAQGVVARERDDLLVAERAADRTQAREDEAARTDGNSRDDDRRAADAERVRRDANERAIDQRRDEDIQRDEASLLAQDRTTQLAASASAVHFGAGRPPAQFEDRDDADASGDDVDAVERIEESSYGRRVDARDAS